MKRNFKTKITLDRALLLGILVFQAVIVTIFLQSGQDAQLSSDEIHVFPKNSREEGASQPPILKVPLPDPDDNKDVPAEEEIPDIASVIREMMGSEASAGDPFEDIFSSDPFADMDEMRARMRQQMNRMMMDASREFERIENIMSFDEGWNDLMIAPTMDMRDEGDHYSVTLSLPGISSNNVTVSINNNVLSIRAEIDSSTESTRMVRSFTKRVRLPGAIDDSSISSSSEENGTLKITLPKKDKNVIARDKKKEEVL